MSSFVVRSIQLDGETYGRERSGKIRVDFE